MIRKESWCKYAIIPPGDMCVMISGDGLVKTLTLSVDNFVSRKEVSEIFEEVGCRDIP